MSEELPDDGRRPRRRRALLVTALGTVLAAAAVLDLAHPLGSSASHPFGHRSPRHAAAGDGADALSTQPVARRTLSSQITDDATLGYAESYRVVNQFGGAAGSRSAQSAGHDVVTSLPKAGQVIQQGEVLYRVDGEPVVLLYGSTPAYRALSEGVTGSDDIRQLNADLVGLGYATSSELDASSDDFGDATKAAVEKLQEHLGVDQTGELNFGDVAFLPTAVRVTSVSATLGGPIGAGSPVLTGTSTTRQVAVTMDTGDESKVQIGDQVSVTLPNNQTTPGVVESIGTTASSGTSGGSQPSGSADTGTGGGSSSSSNSSSDPTVEVDVRLNHPSAAQAWDQAPVQVTITTDTVPNALVVPIVALLARAGGGYAVEVVGGDGTHRLVPVSLGQFDDANGYVQVTGKGLTAGQYVVVPKL